MAPVQPGVVRRTVVRHYNREADYQRVGQFLVRTYASAGSHINWLQPRWEYMHYHPLIKGVDLAAIGVWQAGDQIVGVVHPEDRTGTAYLQVDSAYAHLKGEMLAYAEASLAVATDRGKALRVYINDADAAFQELAAAIGYQKSGGSDPMSCLAVSSAPAPVALPAGFRLKSLADDNDLGKVGQVLWRGFNHQGDPPEDDIDDRRFMQSAPSFRPDLNVVVQAPDGEFAAYCGMWYEPVHRIAMVEPVATDPSYRRRGLGRAAVLEGIRRCAERGATMAYVGSAQPFYQSMGFRQVYTCSVWRREWA